MSMTLQNRGTVEKKGLWGWLTALKTRDSGLAVGTYLQTGSAP